MTYDVFLRSSSLLYQQDYQSSLLFHFHKYFFFKFFNDSYLSSVSWTLLKRSFACLQDINRWNRMTIWFKKDNAHLSEFNEIEMRFRDSKTRYDDRRQAQSSLSARCLNYSSLSIMRQTLLSMSQLSSSLHMLRMFHSLRIALSSTEDCVKYCLIQVKSSFQRSSLSERLRSRFKLCCRRVLRWTTSEMICEKFWESFLWDAIQLMNVAEDSARNRRVCDIDDELSTRVEDTLMRNIKNWSKRFMMSEL